MTNLRLIRTLAVLGFLISSYLLILKLTGKITSLVGCGEGSGCMNVLGSATSQLWVVPVSGLAAGMYALILFATWKVPSRPLYLAFGICLCGAAAWFVGVLIYMGAFCAWCTTMHLIGVATAVVLFREVKKSEEKKGNMHFGIVGGVFAVLLMIVGELIDSEPETHEKEKFSFGEGDKPKEGKGGTPEKGGPNDPNIPVHARGAGRVVLHKDEEKGKRYNTSTLPHHGDPDAPHVVVKYFDYACSSCLQMEGDLKELMKRQPDKFCVIMLPTPLNRECNPHFPENQEPHPGSCELSRLSLAAWRAKPEAYEEVHQFLFTRPLLDPDTAEAGVGAMVGEDALEKALKDPWVEEVVQANIADFKKLATKRIAMPKLLITDTGYLFHGIHRSPEHFIRSMENELKLKKSPTPPGRPR